MTTTPELQAPGAADAVGSATVPGFVEAAMRRAIELGARGPEWGVNPQVGCVLLDGTGRVLAEGWHRGAGTPHAEVDALSKLSTPGLARGAIAVVTLEPCNHHGRTGPCSEALAAAGVGAVYFGVTDPGDASSGGQHRLAEAGVRVRGGVLAGEVERGIHRWLQATRTGRPFVTVKWASSLDGRAAAADGSSRWITGPQARLDVHRRRSLSDAIVVGSGTALADDPALTARDADGELLGHQPRPVVIGHRGVAAGSRLDAARPGGRATLEYRTHDLEAVLADLYANEVRSVFVEGGPTLASAFIAAGLADELVVYVAPVLLGGPVLALGDLGVPSIGAARRLTLSSVDVLGSDLRLVATLDPPTPDPAAPTATEAATAPTSATSATATEAATAPTSATSATAATPRPAATIAALDQKET